jgi:hypothetical protein
MLVEGITTVYINWRGSLHPTAAITIYSIASSNWGHGGSKRSCAANADIAKSKVTTNSTGFDFRGTDNQDSRTVVLAPSGVLVDILRALSAIGIELSQELGRHGRDISTLALLVHTTETGAITNKHVGRGR